jgi:hypothetical protein
MLTTRRLRARRHAPAFVVALLVAACSGATSSPSPSAQGGSSAPPSTAPSASPAPTVGAIDHQTGATDVVLRVEQGGGFVPMDFLASQAPTFILYGTGVIVFQPKAETAPEPDSAGVVHRVACRTASLDEGQIQQLLEFALGPGGLGTAKDAYLEGGIADAPSTIFTLKAGGLDKQVVVSALSGEPVQGPDAAARASFFKLWQRLSDFDAGGSISTDVYQAQQYRGVLSQGQAQPGANPLAWPWASIKPADFKEGPTDGGGVGLPHRTLTSADVDSLGIQDVVGGLQNVALTGPDGKTYLLTVRPLLPDETE